MLSSPGLVRLPNGGAAGPTGGLLAPHVLGNNSISGLVMILFPAGLANRHHLRPVCLRREGGGTKVQI